MVNNNLGESFGAGCMRGVKLGLFWAFVRRLGALTVLSAWAFGRRPRLGIAVFFCLGFITTALDSCGIAARTDAAVATGTAALLSPAYGGLDRVGQESITVLPVTSEVVKIYDGSFWPLPYAGQIALVEAVMRENPAVIMLDFAYSEVQNTHPPRGVPEDWTPGVNADLAASRDLTDMLALQEGAVRFAEALHALSDHYDIPVLIGPVRGDVAGLERLEQLFPELTDPGALGSGQVGVIINDEPVFSYPVRDAEGRLQAAFVLREFVCARRAQAPHLHEPCRPLDLQAVADETVPMVMGWGMGSARIHNALMPELERAHCVAEGVGPRFRHAINLAWRNLTGADARANAPYAQFCAYHDYLPAELFARHGHAEAAVPVEQALVDVTPLIRDRAILIGADIDGLSDSFETPIYDRIAGVRVHAMALDNLIERGRAYTRAPPEDVLLSMNGADLLEFGLLLVALLLIYWSVQSCPADHADDHARTSWGLYLLITIGAIVVGLIVLWLLRWPAVNFLFLIFSLLAASAWLDMLCQTRSLPGKRETPGSARASSPKS